MVDSKVFTVDNTINMSPHSWTVETGPPTGPRGRSPARSSPKRIGAQQIYTGVLYEGSILLLIDT